MDTLTDKTKSSKSSLPKDPIAINQNIFNKRLAEIREHIESVWTNYPKENGMIYG